ncbi:hypothetical protein F4780DRAFT_390758 [Xylariomycetidae sp. FL0641]|nr:hypothetical protein F4780DRAFT_390758 [Xylariomycetidae sp. FL0641]
MSFGSSLFAKLGLGQSMSSILPQYSPPRRGVSQHGLAEMSPKPDEGLLSPGSVHDVALTTNDHNSDSQSNSITLPGSTNIQTSAMSKGKGKARAYVTIQEPQWGPTRTGNPLNDYRAGKRAYQESQQNLNGQELWRPPFPSEPSDPHAPNAGPQLSFFESMFMTRPGPMADRGSPTQVDQTFKLIQRRERQMQSELQTLLDAQGYALDKDLAELNHEDNSERSFTPASYESNRSDEQVMPVRQPKQKHLTKKEARDGIARCMAQLSDLKNEEEAYIATALAERKSALSRLRNLSTRRKSIVSEIRAIEVDRERPIKNQIRDREYRHRMICEEIKKTEEKLRLLKQEKYRLENKLQEAKSVRDSEISGFKGALKECDKGIDDIMRYPNIQILEVEEFMLSDSGIRALFGKHVSGFEFLALRPERRTMDLAKDWWEGEVRVLELRKSAVDRERAALDDGARAWGDALATMRLHDRHMSHLLGVISKYEYLQRDDAKHSEPKEVMRKQYILCQKAVEHLEDLEGYADAQGWTLLVAAVGAELHYYNGLRKHLADTLEMCGFADGIVTPPAARNELARKQSGDDLVDMQEHSPERDHTRLAVHDDEELSGSVIRRWDDVAAGPPADLLGEQHRESDEMYRDNSHKDKSSDNEVPPGLLSEAHHIESEDEHANEVPPGLMHEAHHDSEDEHPNDIPTEFLSMHSPAAKGKSAASAVGEPGAHHRDIDRAEDHGNEVPPGLLSESRRDLDDALD